MNEQPKTLREHVLKQDKRGEIMSSVDRRRFIGSVTATAGVVATPALVKAASNPHVVVVGGGFAGATVAKYLRLWSGGTVDVTLVDRKAGHYSCVMSNLVLNNRLRLNDLWLDYDDLMIKYGVNVVRDNVNTIDGRRMRVRLRDAGWKSYDRLVLAPGIAFDPVPGWNFRRVPHAWIAGNQTGRLRRQLRTMRRRGTFVMTIPKSPFRCPPGPYERACLVADFLGRRAGVIGGNGNGAPPRVVVLDANARIQAEEATFSRAFETIYQDIIEYHTNVELHGVDSIHRVAHTSIGDFDADVLNVIPNNRAPSLLTRAGLVPSGERWAPVDLVGYESTVPGFSGVHIIGDAQASRQPKSGHMANSQAKICADALLRAIAGNPLDDPDRLANITTNSACFSPITIDEASFLTAVYAYNPVTNNMDLTSLGEAERWNREQYRDMFDWADNLWADSFG